MNHYIFESVEKLVKKFKTRDPFQILKKMNVVVLETDKYKNLKGYCFLSCRTIYVVINTFLTEEEKRIVAAHELGHIVLHKKLLQFAPMRDMMLYNHSDSTEYEANLFAADLLLADEDIEKTTAFEDYNYFDLCSSLYTSPELMSFKLYSMIKRGYSQYHMPLEINACFLKDKKNAGSV